MTKWEYWVAFLPSPALYTKDQFPKMWVEDLQQELGVHGKEGWELIERINDYGIFKRPARPEPPALLVVNNIPGTDSQSLIDTIKAELDRYWEEK